jgi:hypothetical protein
MKQKDPLITPVNIMLLTAFFLAIISLNPAIAQAPTSSYHALEVKCDEKTNQCSLPMDQLAALVRNNNMAMEVIRRKANCGMSI